MMWTDKQMDKWTDAGDDNNPSAKEWASEWVIKFDSLS